MKRYNNRGDFNQVVDVEKDKKGGIARTHKRSPEVVQEFSQNLHVDLVVLRGELLIQMLLGTRDNIKNLKYTVGWNFFLSIGAPFAAL